MVPATKRTCALGGLPGIRVNLVFRAVKSWNAANCSQNDSEVHTHTIYSLSAQYTLGNSSCPSIHKNLFWNAFFSCQGPLLTTAKCKHQNSPEELYDFCIHVLISHNLSHYQFQASQSEKSIPFYFCNSGAAEVLVVVVVVCFSSSCNSIKIN